MRLPKRDVIATVVVVVAACLYGLWTAGFAPPGLGSLRVTGSVMLGLGFVASASAVVPAFDQLIHGNKAYVVATSTVGLVALVAGLWMLFAESETALLVLMITMIVLWAASTAHHLALSGPPADRRLRPGRPLTH